MKTASKWGIKPFLSGACLLACTSNALADNYAAPKFNFLRFNEDWSSLKNVDRSDLRLSEKIKHIPLSEDGRFWVSLGGHVQARIEDHSDFAFGGPANATGDFDDAFFVYRGLFHADWHLGDNLRVFTEFKHADIIGRELPGGARSIDEDPAEVQQLFLDYTFDLGGDTSLALRVGRQEFGFGKSRLISPLPWANSLRHWDGVTGILKTPKFDVNFFYSQFVPTDQDGFNDRDSGNLLTGGYARQKLSDSSGIEYYWLGTERDNAVFNGTIGEEDRETFGVRHWGKFGQGFKYEVEGAFQTGEVGDQDISAFMFTGEVTHSWSNSRFKPRVTLAFDYASGDRGNGGEVNTFNQLFPLGHAHLGFIDIIGRQNIVDISAVYWMKPSPKTAFRVAVHNFSRAEEEDALYNAGGGVVRAGDANASREIGTEIDVTFSYKISPPITATVGVSRLFAGDFLTETPGSDEDIGFAFGQLIYNF